MEHAYDVHTSTMPSDKKIRDILRYKETIMAEPKISMREDEMNKVHQEQTRPPVIEADFLFVSLVQLPTIVPALRQAFPRMGEEEILSKLSRAMVKSHLAGKTAAKYAYIPRTDNLDFRE